ncbi:hypothetical protein GW937_00640 [Candidatus Kaiserbacteria bacterium]|nr:hypothetical protein [Candidatus Kaiserbacteria bacterium]NCT01902.1 hypothetical protein [Candidatus Parcubacteria bacterium]
MFKAIGFIIVLFGLSHFFSASFAALDTAASASFKAIETAAIVSQTQLQKEL